MRPVTTALLSSLRGSHGMVARARLVAPGQYGTDPDGEEIPIESGDVTFDATADVRATVDMTTLWPWPTGTSSLFTPYGTEVFIERGIVETNGTREWVSQGYYRITEISQQSAPNGPVRITGQDRMSKVVEARMLAPFELSSSVSVSGMFDFCLGELYPGLPISYDFAAAGTSFSTSHIIEQDRYAFLLDVVRSLGKVFYFAYDGSLVVADAPDPTVPLWEVTHGTGGVLVNLARKLSRQGVYNAVVATGEQPGAALPVRGVALDLDETSPTYWNGAFGHVPRFYSSSFLQTDAQALTAAEAMLVRAKGLPHVLDFQAVPNPALEVLDAVTVSYSDTRPAEIHVIDTLSLPLTAQGVMGGTTRLQRTEVDVA